MGLVPTRGLFYGSGWLCHFPHVAQVFTNTMDPECVDREDFGADI